MTTDSLLSKERFGGVDLWGVAPRLGEPMVDELRRASEALARRGGGLLHWWVTDPTAEHEQAAEAAGFDPYRRLHRMDVTKTSRSTHGSLTPGRDTRLSVTCHRFADGIAIELDKESSPKVDIIPHVQLGTEPYFLALTKH